MSYVHGYWVILVNSFYVYQLYSTHADCRMKCQQQRWWFCSKVTMWGGLVPSPGNPWDEAVHGMILISGLVLVF